MGLKDIRQAGEMATRLTEAATSMSSIHNQYQPKYAELLTAIKASLGEDKTMSNLTDAEVNAFIFGGFGDETAIATAQNILQRWESCLSPLITAVSTLPVNDL